MADVFSKDERSLIMGRIKQKNTKPELMVRSILHGLGYRFRLHRKDLPGTPDITLPKYKTVIFVNGCFWHGHDCKRGRSTPKSNAEFWAKKINKNIVRDKHAYERLANLGWHVLVIWECQIQNVSHLESHLLNELYVSEES